MDALDNLRVIDLSPNRVGAQVSQLFADFGAEVLWIEPPGGAALREHPAFAFWARGKQSVEIDLRSNAGQREIHDLAATADVLIETFRPGTLDRRGLGFDMLSDANPRLVYTSITGFGPHGPASAIPGYEGLVAAKIGLLQAFARIMPLGRPPALAAPWCSFSASQVALHATLAALFERESSGRGQHVETSLAQAFTGLDTWGWFLHQVDQKWPGAYRRVPNYDTDGKPTSPFALQLLVGLTKDGYWLQFAQVAPRLFRALIEALELDWLFDDPDYSGIPMIEDTEKRFNAWSLMLEGVRKKTLAEWRAIFEADPNVFAELFRAGPEALEHPQLLAEGFAVEVEDPERGSVRQPGALFELSETPAHAIRSAPRLGEHAASSGRPIADERPGPTPSDRETPHALPFEGITILELAGLFAAPYGSTLLADLGARVIKVEPLEGDAIRAMVPFPEAGGAKVMQGKESICIDFSTPDGLALVHELARRSDVVMQGFRAGVAERLELGYERLRALHPEIIYVNAQGYGNGGPDGHRPAYAPSFGAAAGIARANMGPLLDDAKDADLDQIRASARLLALAGTVVQAQADGFAALGVASALALGLLARARGAGAQEISATMLRTNVHAMSGEAVTYPGSPAAPAPDSTLRGFSALYRVYDASDGWVFLATPQEHEWQTLVEALAPYADLASDPLFATAEERTTNDAALAEMLAEVFTRRTKGEWEHDLLAAGVGCVAVATVEIEEVYLSEDFGRASDYVVDVVHPTFDDHPRLAPLARFSRSSTRALPGVLAGAHTDSILAELGRSASTIADLHERKIVC